MVKNHAEQSTEILSRRARKPIAHPPSVYYQDGAEETTGGPCVCVSGFPWRSWTHSVVDDLLGARFWQRARPPGTFYRLFRIGWTRRYGVGYPNSWFWVNVGSGRQIQKTQTKTPRNLFDSNDFSRNPTHQNNYTD